MIATFLSALPVFLMIAAGYVAAWAGVVPATANRELNRFVMWIALPAMMFSIVATTDWHRIWNTDFVIASLAGGFAAFGAGMVVGRLRKLPVADIAIDGLNASYSNVAYMGLPLLMLVLGRDSAPLVVVAATLLLMSLFGCAVIAIELGHNRQHGVAHALGKAAIGVIRNPVLASSLAGFLWWCTGRTLPGPIDHSTHLLGAAASPTALVAIGLLLAENPVRQAVSNRFVLMLTAVKLIVHPAITAFIAYGLLDMKGLPAVIVVAVAGLPTGTGPFMVAGFYARDGKVSSGTILLSVLFSIVTLTIILSFLSP